MYVGDHNCFGHGSLDALLTEATNPVSPARNSTSGTSSPSEGKVSYVEFGEARNREGHPAQVE